MNLDNTIEIIPLGNRPVSAGCITDKMLKIIEKNIAHSKKTLIFYNRRGSASAYICRDCGFFEKCPNCDIAFSYHNFPRKHLLCHQCQYKEGLFSSCQKCGGNNFTTVGIGIEEVAKNLENLSGTRVEIFDSDHIKKPREIFEKFENSEIIIATSLASLFLDDRIGAIIFALFEINISIPDYTLEEQLYAQIAYFKKTNLPLYIQTFAPEHPLLQEIVFKNYKSFFEKLKNERKIFSYPPFSDFVVIRICHKDLSRVKNMLSGLVEHIEKCDLNGIFFSYDTDFFEKSHGEYMQKIILKGKGIANILENISPIIIKNRYIFVEWQ